MLIPLLYLFVCITLIALLLAFPGIAHEGTDLGVKLFMEALFPYLLPYLILTQWFIRLTPNRDQTSRLKLYFKTYGISALGGFPTGAATIAFLKKTNQISKREASGLLSICHSPSPLFVLGFVGHDLLSDTGFSWRFLILYHAVSVVMLMLFYFYHRSHALSLDVVTEQPKKHENPFVSSVKDSVPTVLVVGATIIFFTTIYTVVMHTIQSIIPNIHKNLLLFTAASLEMTNGLQISQVFFANETTLLLVLMATFLSSQSLSIHMQVAVIAKTENISLKPYFLLRLLFTFCIPFLYFLIFL